MGTPISAVLDQYEAAKSDDIRAWSRGAVKRRLTLSYQRGDWRQTAGTLWDERIFGPVKDFECACGRVSGEEHSGAICPICRIPVISNRARTFRMAHINLPFTIAHPFFADVDRLDAIPIVPAKYWETPSGAALAKEYEEIIRLSLIESQPDDVVGAYGVVLVHLEHLYEHAVIFDPEEHERLARGMMLKPRLFTGEAVKETHEPAITEAPSTDDDWGELRLAPDDD